MQHNEEQASGTKNTKMNLKKATETSAKVFAALAKRRKRKRPPQKKKK